MKEYSLNIKITYNNFDLNKSRIYAKNRHKSGIYRLINIITNESYIRHSNNLTNTLRMY